MRTGIAASGGETTGVLITTKGGFGCALAGKVDEKFDKKVVVVTGTYAEKGGVEVRSRRGILTVASIRLAEDKPDEQYAKVKMKGTVKTGAGGGTTGVTVTAVCTDTNLTRTAITDGQGTYSIPELPGCVYRVTAELAGFKSIAREAPVTANAVAKTDFRLEVGTVSETVTVEGVSPLVERK